MALMAFFLMISLTVMPSAPARPLGSTELALAYDLLSGDEPPWMFLSRIALHRSPRWHSAGPLARRALLLKEIGVWRARLDAVRATKLWKIEARRGSCCSRCVVESYGPDSQRYALVLAGRETLDAEIEGGGSYVFELIGARKLYACGAGDSPLSSAVFGRIVGWEAP